MHARTARSRLVVLIALEAAAIPLLQGQGGTGVDWSHLGDWITGTAPEDAVVAVVRLVALLLAAWLLATTTVYFLARLTRAPALVRATSWATLPAIRRLVDAAMAVTLVGSTVVGAYPAGAQVNPPPIVVELNSTTTTTAAHLYVPVPAGDRFVAPATTVTIPRSLAPPPAPSPSAIADPAARTHTVVPGDNLWTIAAAELSRQTGRTPDHLAEVEIRNYWVAVITANRAHLRSGDPNLIYPGESIILPLAS